MASFSTMGAAGAGASTTDLTGRASGTAAEGETTFDEEAKKAMNNCHHERNNDPAVVNIIQIRGR